MLDARETALVQELRRRLEELLGPRLLGLTVFGSRARGTARPNSDLDVLVLLDSHCSELRRAIHHAADDVSLGFDYSPPVAPLVMARPEFDLLVERERRLALDILREGIPV